VLLETDLPALYQALNREFFQDELAPCSIRWSRRLTRTAGNIRVRERLITLSVPLLLDVWTRDCVFQVCGVPCSSSGQALVEILKHEMIHLWLFEQKLPCGHTREFRRKARQIGQPKTRHGIALPPPKSGWIYECASCQSRLFRRRRLGKRVACATCCRQKSGGNYDERFRLRGRRLKNEEEVGQATR
jgi:predicted SprT family Zn-dependent metalloprotease